MKGCLLAALLLVSVVSHAQPASSRSNTHSVGVYQTQEDCSSAFHFSVGGGAGYQIYSITSNPSIDAHISGIWESKKGLVLGAGLAPTFSINNGGGGGQGYRDFRLLADIGYVHNFGKHSVFALAQPGLSMISTKTCDYYGTWTWLKFEPAFTVGAKIGYRYMFSNHFGLSISMGVQTTLSKWVTVPIAVSFIF